MKLLIKNMVCNRCIMVVRQEFEKTGLKPIEVIMGEVELSKEPTKTQLQALSEKLEHLGFEILDDQKKKQIEKIKSLLINQVQSGQIAEHFSVSYFLSKK